MRLFQAFEKGLDWLLTATAWFGAILLIVMSLAMGVQVVARVVFSASVRAAFEIPMFGLVVFPFLTAAYLDQKQGHVGVDVLTSHLTARERTMLKVAVYLAGLAYAITFGWQAMGWAVDAFQKGQVTIGTWQIPRGILISGMAVGMFIFAVQIIRVLINSIRSLRSQGAAKGDRSWLCLLLFIINVAVGIWLFLYVNPIAGLFYLIFVFLFAGMSVFLTLGLVGMLGLYLLIGQRGLIQAPIKAYEHLYSFPLTCLPLFILAGLIMERSRTIDGVFHLAELWVGNYASAVLIATIITGLVFCATTGSSTGATAVVGALCLPLLTKRGYSKVLICGVVAACTVGSLIPPSVGLVISAVIMNLSVGKLFIAVTVPGLIVFGLTAGYVIFLDRFNKKALFEGGEIPPLSTERITWGAKFGAFKDAVWGLLAPVIALGGIYTGVLTPTEAAGALAIYSIVASRFITRTLNWREIMAVSVKSTETSTMVLCIIFAAFGLGMVITQVRITPALVGWAEGIGLGQIGVLVFIFIVLTILGMFMDAASMKLITLPTFFPLAVAVGIDPVWFAVFYQFNSEICLLTPPVGLDLFVMQSITGFSLTTVVKGCFPFILIMMLTLIVMYFFPQVVLWLPGITG